MPAKAKPAATKKPTSAKRPDSDEPYTAKTKKS
jgi:hypothetical protein